MMIYNSSSSSSPPATSPDFTSNPLIGVVIGGIIAAGASLFGIYLTARQQYQQQLKREQATYARNLKDAKRERLRTAYKVILNAAEEYQSVTKQLTAIMQSETIETRNQRLNASLNKELAGVNLAMIEITLEDVGLEVRTLFVELRQAFTSYALSLETNTQVSGSYFYEQLTKQENTVINKVKELTTAMQTHLKELEM